MVTSRRLRKGPSNAISLFLERGEHGRETIASSTGDSRTKTPLDLLIEQEEQDERLPGGVPTLEEYLRIERLLSAMPIIDRDILESVVLSAWFRDRPLAEVEDEAIRRAMIRLDGDKKSVARSLGICLKGLYLKLERLGLHLSKKERKRRGRAEQLLEDLRAG